jgi:hypothetical protein
MKIIISWKITIFFILTLISCKSALIDVESQNTKLINGKYSFENESIKVDYNFWHKQGVMAFSIKNKLNKPLYIDWKKSAFIMNGQKLDYWYDSEIRNTVGIQNWVLSSYPNWISSTVVRKPERVTFLPPGSQNYYAFYMIIANDETLEEIKQIALYDKKLAYNEFNSPIKFSNFLTYSENEQFTNENYINNSFYISKFAVFNRSKIKNEVELINGEIVNYKKPTRFHINL